MDCFFCTGRHVKSLLSSALLKLELSDGVGDNDDTSIFPS